MKRPATWKVLTIGTTLAGLSVIGAGAAAAQPEHLRESAVTVTAPLAAPAPAVELASSVRSCMNKGAFTTHCQTNGSNQIHTAPNPHLSKPWAGYGPYFNRGIANALR